MRRFLRGLPVLPLAAAAGLFAQTPPAGPLLTVEAVAARPDLWPRHVITKVPARVNVVVNGVSSGAVSLPAGQLMKLVRVEGGNAVLEFNGSPVTLPAVDTDLLSGAATRQAQLTAQSAAPAAPIPAPAARPGTPAPRPAAMAGSPTGGIASSAAHALAPRIERALVRQRDGQVSSVPAAEAKLGEKKYVVLYYSASWCGPCRRFTPELVAHYQRRRDKSALYEVVLVPRDRSAAEEAAYMKKENMPWPAVDFGQSSAVESLATYHQRGIPCLVIVDANGKVLSHSYEGEKYVGPQKVLRDLDRLLDRG